MDRILTEFALKSLVVTLSFLSLTGFSEGYPRKKTVAYQSYQANNSQTLKTTVRPAPSPAAQTKFFGNFEVRPAWDTLHGTFNSENSAELGVDLKTWRLSYEQDIDTEATNGTNPHNPILQDSFLRVKFPNLWTNGDTGFTDEFRAYFPVNEEARDHGMVTIIRNGFILTHKISPYVSFTLMEAPMIHAYSDAGAETTSGPVANPIFENRNVVAFDFNLSQTVTFSMPLHFYAKKYRDYRSGAKNNADWAPSLFIWPELRWAANPNLTLGTAYRTNSFFNVDETGTVPGDGGGAFQAIIGVSF